MIEINRYMKDRDVPAPLQSRARKYLEYVYSDNMREVSPQVTLSKLST